MRVEICNVDKNDMTVCWAIDGGRIFIHFTTNLSELLSLRKKVDEMISSLEEIKKGMDEKHKQELSLRAKRAKEIRKQ